MSQPYPQQPDFLPRELPAGRTAPAGEQRATTIRVIAAAATLVGAAAILASYLLTWYTLGSDNSITVNGFGQVTSPDYEFETNRVHWLAGAGALFLIVAAIVALVGKYTTDWTRGTLVAMTAALFGALPTFCFVPDGLQRGSGIYLMVAGGLIAAAGAAVIALLTR